MMFWLHCDNVMTFGDLRNDNKTTKDAWNYIETGTQPLKFTLLGVTIATIYA